jgi:polyferredoxin
MKKLLFLAALVLGMSSCSLCRECQQAVDVKELYGYKTAYNIQDVEFEALESYNHMMNALYYLDSKDNTSRYRILYEKCMDIMYNRSGSIEDAVTDITQYLISYDNDLYQQIMK